MRAWTTGASEQLGDEVLAEQPDRTPLDRLGGMGVPVADASGHAAEQVPRDDPTAVVGDPADVHRGRVPRGLDDVDVVEEEVHLHGSCTVAADSGARHGRSATRRQSARRWYLVT